MSVQFEVTREGDDRILRLADGTLVGWTERGRQMVVSQGRFTEWGFTPADSHTPASPVRNSISAAYDDARDYAATLQVAS